MYNNFYYKYKVMVDSPTNIINIQLGDILEIIAPDRLIIKTETSEVIIPSYEGEMGILKDHISLITFLRPGVIEVKGDLEKFFFVEEGTVEFSNNCLLILTSTVKELSSLSKNSKDLLISDAQKKINSEVTDKEKYLLSHKLEALKNIS